MSTGIRQQASVSTSNPTGSTANASFLSEVNSDVASHNAGGSGLRADFQNLAAQFAQLDPQSQISDLGALSQSGHGRLAGALLQATQGGGIGDPSALGNGGLGSLGGLGGLSGTGGLGGGSDTLSLLSALGGGSGLSSLLGGGSGLGGLGDESLLGGQSALLGGGGGL